jgi:hypothetical protein
MARIRVTRFGALLGSTLALMLPAAFAQAAERDAQVRFLHTVPGVGVAELSADGDAVGEAGFGEASDFAGVAPGPVKLVLEAPEGVVLRSEETLDAGRSYTVIAMATKDAAELVLVPDGTAKPGVARLRLIHAAMELGEPNVVVGGKTVAREVPYQAVSPYFDLPPDSYPVSLNDPETGEPVLATRVSLAAGTTSTAAVVGSRGEPARAVLLSDATAAPAAAPEAGFGGLANEGPSTLPTWLIAIAAATLAAGLLRAVSGRRFR